MSTQVLQESRPQEIHKDVLPQGAAAVTPEVDVKETAENYVVDVYMPGVSERSTEATLENDVLTIRGQIERPSHDGFRLAYQEYQGGEYRRRLTLSPDIDRDRVSATVRDGVLRLVLPKSETAKAKRITIKAA